MRSETLKADICVAANIQCPEWLKRKRDVDWLQECLKLVKADVVVITSSGADFRRDAPADRLVEHAHEIAWLLSVR